MNINAQFITWRIFRLLGETTSVLIGFSVFYLSYEEQLEISLLYLLCQIIVCLEIWIDIIAFKKYWKIYGAMFDYKSPNLEVWKYKQRFFIVKRAVNISRIIYQLSVSIFALTKFSQIQNYFLEPYIFYMTVQSTCNLIYFIAFQLNSCDIMLNMDSFKKEIKFPIYIRRNMKALDDPCCICLEEGFGKEWCELPCKHKFHYNCVGEWIKSHTNCPLCRQSNYKYFSI